MSSSMSMIRQAVVLAGGKGTRLGSISQDTPKPFLEVGWAPFVTVLLNQLASSGVERVLFSLGHLAEVAESILSNIHVFGLDISTVVEEAPLNTGGAVRHCARYLDESFYVMNGDSYFGFDLIKLVEAMSTPGVLAALSLRPVADTARYGAVECEEGLVTAFTEKQYSSGGGLINAGVYAMRKKVLDMIPEGVASLEHDIFSELAESGQLAGVEAQGVFIDIGIPEDFKRAQALFSCGQPVGPQRGGE